MGGTGGAAPEKKKVSAHAELMSHLAVRLGMLGVEPRGKEKGKKNKSISLGVIIQLTMSCTLVLFPARSSTPRSAYNTLFIPLSLQPVGLPPEPSSAVSHRLWASTHVCA